MAEHMPQDDAAAGQAEAASGAGSDAGTAEALARAADAAVARQFADEGRSPFSPEARRARAERREAIWRDGGLRLRAPKPGMRGWRSLSVAKRVVIGTYFDGFIHAGNLAYLSLIALFPFFITATAVMSALGQTREGLAAIELVLASMPGGIGATLEAPVREALAARTGPLLWLGALVGLWTVGSLIETIRDILRRAYGVRARKSFFHYRLYSIGIIVGAVLVLLLSFSLQVATVGVEQFVSRLLPWQFVSYGEIALSRGLSAAGLFLSLYFLFYTLTPEGYRARQYPKWPGALATTLWWIGVTLALPPLLASLLSYSLTYGSLAGVMIALLFFYLIGLGVVIGAELNAALAESNGESRSGIGDAERRQQGMTT